MICCFKAVITVGCSYTTAFFPGVISLVTDTFLIVDQIVLCSVIISMLAAGLLSPSVIYDYRIFDGRLVVQPGKKLFAFQGFAVVIPFPIRKNNLWFIIVYQFFHLWNHITVHPFFDGGLCVHWMSPFQQRVIESVPEAGVADRGG